MEPTEELHSFQFCQQLSGVEYDYRITERAAHIFGVEKDSSILAELTNNDGWKQLSGEPLGDALMEKICNHIEDYYA